MKRRRYLQIILALVVILIIGGTVLINSPRVQQRVSVALATELENRIGTRVNLGGVRWLFPNDEKTLAVLKHWYAKAKSAIHTRRERRAEESK